jgi:formylglycine-generating enzyme required for sulfatase activity
MSARNARVCLTSVTFAALCFDSFRFASGQTELADKRAGQVRDDNVLKMNLVWCPSGKFTMGTPEAEAPGRRVPQGEEQVEVSISRGFWLGKYELTQGEWVKIMGTTLRQQVDGDNTPYRGKPTYGTF